MRAEIVSNELPQRRAVAHGSVKSSCGRVLHRLEELLNEDKMLWAENAWQATHQLLEERYVRTKDDVGRDVKIKRFAIARTSCVCPWRPIEVPAVRYATVWIYTHESILIDAVERADVIPGGDYQNAPWSGTCSPKVSWSGKISITIIVVIKCVERMR